MRVGFWINHALLTMLSISTGAVKIGHLPEEMALFRGAGVPDGVTVAFGVLQLSLGVLLVPRQTTVWAAWGMLGTFVLATGVLFVNGMVPFGVFSLLFIASAAFHARQAPRFRP